MSQVALNFLCENQNTELEYVFESQNIKGEQHHFLTGPMLMANSPNRNKRIYKLDEMVQEVARYDKDYIKTNRACGELNHPKNATDINPANICHMVTEMHQEGNMFYGKTKILSTPSGTIVKQLLSDGVRLGISSRALGSLVPQADGTNLVENFHLICLDLVMEPSVGSAMLESVMESKQYIIDEGGRIVELAVDQLSKSVKKIPTAGRKEYLEEAFKKFFDSLKA